MLGLVSKEYTFLKPVRLVHLFLKYSMSFLGRSVAREIILITSIRNSFIIYILNF